MKQTVSSDQGGVRACWEQAIGGLCDDSGAWLVRLDSMAQAEALFDVLEGAYRHGVLALVHSISLCAAGAMHAGMHGVC